MTISPREKTRPLDWKRLSLITGLILLTFSSLCLRLSYNMHTQIDTPIQRDAEEYVTYAFNLVEHHVFSRDKTSLSPKPDAYRTPGYPIFLALVIHLFGKKYFYQNTILIQALLGSFLVLLTYLLARFMLPVWAAIIPAILVSVSPHLISLGNYILSETLFSFLLLLSLCLFFFSRRRGNPWLSAITGRPSDLPIWLRPQFFSFP